VTIRARALLCVPVMQAVTLTACTDARRADPVAATATIHVGTFIEGSAGRIAAFLSWDFLVTPDWEGRTVFRLAESGFESPDGLSLTFHLRPNITFHSGEPLSAARVRQILEGHSELMEELTGIDLDGDMTLILRLKRPHSLKLIDLSRYAIVGDDDVLLRTGPFMIVDEETPALEPFDAYHEGRPTVSRVEIREYSSQRAAWTAMMRGEINVLHEVSRDAIDFLQTGGSITAYPLLRPYYLALVFNVEHAVLGRRDVRRALVEAVDRDELVRTALRGHGQPADGPFWPHHWAYSGTQTPVPHNPTAATIRLETASLPVRHSADAMPSRLAFTCLLLEGDDRFERLALLIQRQLSAIGVDMRLQALPPEVLLRRIVSGQYDAFLLEFVNARTLGFPYALWHSRTSRLSTGYTAADAALDRMAMATAETDVRAAVADVMRIMRADPPAIFLAWPREVRAADRSLDLPYEPDRDVFGTLWQARPAAPLQDR
jgi:peptide/nickel transport system substrate-binding protein